MDRAAPLLDRKARGAWATPHWLVEHLLDVVLEPVLATRTTGAGLRVLDPACGDGRFLAAAAARIDRRFGASSGRDRPALVGIDLDAATAAEARERLGPEVTIVVGDALRMVHQERFDVVVGNPPFLNQLARATTRRGRSEHGGGPYADAAVEFLALALRLARPDGGRVGLVLPQSLLASRDAADVRREAAGLARLDGLWWSAGEMVFDAQVHTVAAAFVLGERQQSVRRWRGEACHELPPADGTGLDRRPTWSHLLADAAGIPVVETRTDGVLADRATATAGFRDQFYGLIPFVRDGPDDAPLVTSGLLDPGRSAWGERPARFGGRRYLRPGVDLAALGVADARLAAWTEARRVPKVLLATQTAVLEAAVDEQGTWIPSVPVVSVEPRTADDLWPVGAVLCSPVTSAWAAATYLGAGLGPATIKLSAAQTLTIPWPAGPLDDAAELLRAGDLDGAGVASTRAYGLRGAAAAELLAWWRARVSAARRRSARASGC